MYFYFYPIHLNIAPETVVKYSFIILLFIIIIFDSQCNLHSQIIVWQTHDNTHCNIFCRYIHKIDLLDSEN